MKKKEVEVLLKSDFGKLKVDKYRELIFLSKPMNPFLDDYLGLVINTDGEDRYEYPIKSRDCVGIVKEIKENTEFHYKRIINKLNSNKVLPKRLSMAKLKMNQLSKISEYYGLDLKEVALGIEYSDIRIFHDKEEIFNWLYKWEESDLIDYLEKTKELTSKELQGRTVADYLLEEDERILILNNCVVFQFQ